MRKYLIAGFLVLSFGFICFAQNPLNFKIEDFVLAKMEVNKTAIFVGDRFELKIEIFYPKDWGIKILTEDLEKSSMNAVLPSSIVLEKAEISKSIAWNRYWLKIEAVYRLFYPEKKHNIGILFNPQDLNSIKIRFKWIDEESKEPREDIRIYEVNVRPGQFVQGVRTTLTDTSNRPRDSKVFSENFTLKIGIGFIVGFFCILFGLFIPVKALIIFVKNRGREKEVSIKQLLRNEYERLQVLREISDLKEFSDSFCLVLRNLIGIKTGLKTLSMTAVQIKEEVAGGDGHLIELAGVLEKVDDLRYNPRAKPVPKEELLKITEDAFSNWMGSYKRKKWLKS